MHSLTRDLSWSLSVGYEDSGGGGRPGVSALCLGHWMEVACLSRKTLAQTEACLCRQGTRQNRKLALSHRADPVSLESYLLAD